MKNFYGDIWLSYSLELQYSLRESMKNLMSFKEGKKTRMEIRVCKQVCVEEFEGQECKTCFKCPWDCKTG